MKLRQFRSALPGVVHEVLKAIGVLADDMGYSAYLVGGIVPPQFGGPDVTVHGRYAAISEHIIEPHPGSFDARNGMPEIDKGA